MVYSQSAQLINGQKELSSESISKAKMIYDKLSSEIEWKTVPKELCMFLSLKAVYGNKKADDLSPTKEIDKVWHESILDTELYRRIEKICGTNIVHKPERSKDSKEKIISRIQMTAYLARKIFNYDIHCHKFNELATNPYNMSDDFLRWSAEEHKIYGRGGYLSRHGNLGC